MKVKELIAQLEQLDPELTVLGYNALTEDGGDCYGAAYRDGSKFPYCKADPPQGYEEGKPFVLISIE